jgi:hypothetical protein
MRLLRGISGRVLPCGCLVGVYETYSNAVVATIDACGPACADHRLHQVVDLEAHGATPPAQVDRHVSTRV